MKELTKAEEQVMQILWKIKKGFVKDVIEHFKNPGFVNHKAYGKTHEYFPVVSKESYTKSFFGNFLDKYFSNSFQQLVSFFSENEELSIEEMEKIKQLLDEQIKNKKK